MQTKDRLVTFQEKTALPTPAPLGGSWHGETDVPLTPRTAVRGIFAPRTCPSLEPSISAGNTPVPFRLPAGLLQDQPPPHGSCGQSLFPRCTWAWYANEELTLFLQRGGPTRQVFCKPHGAPGSGAGLLGSLPSQVPSPASAVS